MISYSFFGFDLDHICDLERCTKLGSVSSTSSVSSDSTTILLYSAPKNYLETVDQTFYKPYEVVNATEYTYGDSWLGKPNAIDALYAYETDSKKSRDEYDIVNGQDQGFYDDQPIMKIPILISEGL